MKLGKSLGIYSICLGILLVAQPLVGQQPAQPDPLIQYTFPPPLVMSNQQAVGLSEDQKESIKTQIRKSEVKFLEMQWKLQDEMETFVLLLKQPRVDEQKALAQLDKILKVETEIKREHLALQIRIKNLLTPEQQEKLQKIKEESAPGRSSLNVTP